MRRPHPRIRKATKWTSTIFALILVAAWGVSEFRSFGLTMQGWSVEFQQGSVIASEETHLFKGSPPFHSTGWAWDSFDRANERRNWWVASQYRYLTSFPGSVTILTDALFIPLWMPLCILIPLSVATWWLDHLAQLRGQLPLCLNCYYNLTGLRPGSNCPECNTPPLSVECKEQ